jgi:preprotein translocase subunit SecY
MVVSIVFVNEAIRRIPIQYARRVRGVDATQSSYLPFKLTQAGVMPIIFASSVLTFPTIIAQFITGTADPGSRVYEIAINITNLEVFNFRSYQYLILYFVLIFFFAFFYTFVVMKPEDTSENLQKSGGFIPGIRPGNATTKFITSTLVRLTFVGAIFLALLAVIPSLVRLTDQGADLLIFTGIGGTSLLIIVSVILDTLRQAKSFTLTRSYEMYK